MDDETVRDQREQLEIEEAKAKYLKVWESLPWGEAWRQYHAIGMAEYQLIRRRRNRQEQERQRYKSKKGKPNG